MGNVIDMTGWVMSEHGVSDSRLIVIKRVEDYVSPKGAHAARWLCECTCGQHNQLIVTGSCARNGKVKSCGCLNRENSIQKCKKCKKYNTYDITSYEYGVGWTTNTNKEFYFDLEDYDKIKNYCWYEAKSHKGYSALKTHLPDTKKCIKMHQLLGYSGYDHENRNSFDNRKENLRLCTAKENNRNQNRQWNNTSGFTGISWNKANSKWEVYIDVDGKRIKLGMFHVDDKNNAIVTRLRAEKEYFGEFAPQRHLFEEYGIV